MGSKVPPKTPMGRCSGMVAIAAALFRPFLVAHRGGEGRRAFDEDFPVADVEAGHQARRQDQDQGHHDNGRRHAGAQVRVVDVGVDHDFEGIAGLIHRKVTRGTRNFAKGPAMSRDEMLAALQVGIDLADQCRAEGVALVGTGEMGIGNTTPSSAIIAAISGKTVAEVTHRGTGIGDEALLNKIRVINKGLEVNKPDPNDPLDVLAKVGGLEIAAIAGLGLGCAANSIPVVIDGFISTAGALIASELHPNVREYIFAAHQSVEVGHRFMLERIGAEPILDLGLRLGEGTGAALAMTLIEAGVKIMKEMATFEQAGVTH